MQWETQKHRIVGRSLIKSKELLEKGGERKRSGGDSGWVPQVGILQMEKQDIFIFFPLLSLLLLPASLPVCSLLLCISIFSHSCLSSLSICPFFLCCIVSPHLPLSSLIPMSADLAFSSAAFLSLCFTRVSVSILISLSPCLISLHLPPTLFPNPSVSVPHPPCRRGCQRLWRGTPLCR